MLTTLDRFIIRSFAVNYVIAITSMIGLYIVLDLFFNLDEFMEGPTGFGGVVWNIIDFYYHNTFLYFSQISGVITLFAASCTLARMQRNNEMVGALAAGISMHRLAVPVVLAGLATNVLWVIDQEIIIPSVAPKLARAHEDVEGATSRNLRFLRDRGGNLLCGTDFQPKKAQMRELIVIMRDESGSLSEMIRADRATWDEELGAWRLERGILHRRLSTAGQDLGDFDATERTPIDIYESDLSPDQIMLRQAVVWQDLLSLRQLSALADADYIDPKRVAEIRHSRFALPLMNLVLLLVGIPFFLNREPSSVIVQASKSLLNAGLCFTVTFISQKVIHSDAFPALTAWFPIMVFGPLAVLYMDTTKT